ncbi:GNAT family N-acetyltransferase [Bacillus shivajii]|uniref:GNAT family N-acetyltransferase n=1 Tax=Bacillus shivajii TaxID=1983719 RepID=UPI001CFC11FA|nr:GNAT family N-acetyltransferase [Bacillus shivajii]UCZ54237.1 GNAT family N-acetyltransferase [Bacillus shivajii]
MFEWKWMTNEEAMAIVQWEYDGEEAFYNIDDGSDDIDEFLNPFNWNHYIAIYESGELIGYCIFLPKDVIVGMQLVLRPDLIGQGRGESLIAYVMNIAKERYEPKKLTFHIPKFNKRALKATEKLGFKRTITSIVQKQDHQVPLIKMEYDF